MLPLLVLPMPITPLQILWLNLVTDVVPALALAGEPGDPRVMERPPRPPRQPILERALLLSAVAHAAVLALATIGAFATLLAWDRPGAGAAAFLTLGAAQVLHLGNARSASAVLSTRAATANPWALVAVAVCAVLLLASAHLPPLARLLSLVDVGLLDWAVVIGFAAVPAVAGQLWRLRATGMAA
jgi:Ca2+-transporting ATPase